MNKEIEQNKDKYKDDLFTVVITSSLDDRKKSRAASIVKTWLGGSSSDIKELMNGSVPIEVRKHLSYEKAYKAIFNLKDEDIDAELVNETAKGSSAAVATETYDVSETPEENAPATDNVGQLAQVELEKAQAEKAAAQQAQAELAAAKAELKAKTEVLSPQEQIASLGDSPYDYDFHKNYAISRMEKSWSYLEMMKLKIDNLVMDLLRKLLF